MNSATAADEPATSKLGTSETHADRTQDAAALVEQFGADGVDWLDSFLADYVFLGEPLDSVLINARKLAGLPARPEPELGDDH